MEKRAKNKNPNRLRVFCREYVKDFNATRAAKEAGYAPGSAYVTGSRLLRNAKVQQFIDKLLQRDAAEAGMRRQEILSELKRIALADPRALIDPRTGAVKNLEDWPDDLALAISGVKVKEHRDRQGKITGHTKEFKFWDKTKALELHGKAQKMFTDKVEHSGEMNHTVAVVSVEQLKKLKDEFDSEY